MARWSGPLRQRFGAVALFFVLGAGLATAVAATTSWDGWASPAETSDVFDAAFDVGRDQALAEAETRVAQRSATAFARGLAGGEDGAGRVVIQAVRLLALHAVLSALARPAGGYQAGYAAGLRAGRADGPP